MSSIRLSRKKQPLKGHLELPGSKSISNRVLIMDAYGRTQSQFTNLSSSDDTKSLIQALNSGEKEINVGHAGTSFRFLLSFLSIQDKERILLGSAKLNSRPISPLVDALNQMGADIHYLENKGHAPLLIKPVNQKTLKNRVTIEARVSSQFISSLLMLGPNLNGGLTIELLDKRVSKPYLDMTISLMADFGIEVNVLENGYYVPEGKYQTRNINVESDWSSASYLILMAALADEAKLSFASLSPSSIQGDAAILDLLSDRRLVYHWEENVLHISKTSQNSVAFVERDFIDYPDLFQGLSVYYALEGTSALIKGLDTLKTKETDRILAMHKELSKFGIALYKTTSKLSPKTGATYYVQEGELKTDRVQIIDTYKDHRMAMAFSLLAMKFPIIIKDPEVVAKSYPGFWQDLEKLGFQISTIQA